VTDKNDLPKVKSGNTPKYMWEPDEIVIHKQKGVGKKPVAQTDPQPKSTAPKGG
jgi:hypothetical protein